MNRGDLDRVASSLLRRHERVAGDIAVHMDVVGAFEEIRFTLDFKLRHGFGVLSVRWCRCSNVNRREHNAPVPLSRSPERERWGSGWRMWWWWGASWGGGRIPRARAWGFLTGGPTAHAATLPVLKKPGARAMGKRVARRAAMLMLGPEKLPCPCRILRSLSASGPAAAQPTVPRSSRPSIKALRVSSDVVRSFASGCWRISRSFMSLRPPDWAS